MQADHHHDLKGGSAPSATGSILSQVPPFKAGPRHVERRNSIPTSIGSDSSFASSEASFSISEASYASTRTANSQHSIGQDNSIDVFDHASGLHDAAVTDESFNHVYNDLRAAVAVAALRDDATVQDGGPARPRAEHDSFAMADDLLRQNLNCHPLRNLESSAVAGVSSISDREYLNHGSRPTTSYRATAAQLPAASHPLQALLNPEHPRVSTSITLPPQLGLEVKTSEGANHAPSAPNPRRTSSDPARVPPTLVRQEERKNVYVEELIDITEQLVGMIWPGCRSTLTWQSRTGSRCKVPLRSFIKEILRRSRASHSTLQMAMYYCYLVWKSDRPLPDIDGRRMFLASVMLAFKYLQDRNYSAKAWSSISGLVKDEIMSTQTEFLRCVDYRLFLHVGEWDAWRSCIDKCIEQRRLNNQQCLWPTLLRGMKDHQATNEQLREQHRTKRASLLPMDWTGSTSAPVVVFEPSSSSSLSSSDAQPSVAYTAPQPVVSTTRDEVAQVEFRKPPTPPLSPPVAPKTPFISTLSSPEIESAPLPQGTFVHSVPATQDSPRHMAPPSGAVPAYAITNLPDRPKPTAAAVAAPTPNPHTTERTIGNLVHEDGPNAPESTPEFTAVYQQSLEDNWYEEHSELIEIAEDQADRKLAQRSAKSSHAHHYHHKANGHSRKRSIARCLDKDLDIGREERSSKLSCRVR